MHCDDIPQTLSHPNFQPCWSISSSQFSLLIIYCTSLHLFIFSEFMQAVTSGCVHDYKTICTPWRGVPYHSPFSPSSMMDFWVGDIAILLGAKPSTVLYSQHFDLLWIPPLTIAYCWKLPLSLRLRVVLVYGYKHVYWGGISTSYSFDIKSVVGNTQGPGSL